MSDNLLRPYGSFRPTGFDPPGLGCEDQQDWLVSPVSQTRDSGVLDKSNFRVVLKSFEEVDPDEHDFEIHRFGHWGPGWFELILVRPDTKCAELAEEWAAALFDYPVACEHDYSELEVEEAENVWASMSLDDKIDVCKRFRISIFAARRDEIPQCPQGGIISYLAGDY